LTLLSLLGKLWSRTVWRSELEMIYAYDPVRQGAGKSDDEVVCCEHYDDIPAGVAAQLFASPGSVNFDLMRWRMKQGRARLVYILQDGLLAAYGWIQDWDAFRRKYRFLAKDGTLLGPYWTRPEFRGRGIYGRLLLHSIHCCQGRKLPILIAVHPGNDPSTRGVEKAGFVKLGTYRLTSALFGLIWKISCIEHNRDLGDLAGG